MMEEKITYENVLESLIRSKNPRYALPKVISEKDLENLTRVFVFNPKTLEIQLNPAPYQPYVFRGISYSTGDKASREDVVKFLRGIAQEEIRDHNRILWTKVPQIGGVWDNTGIVIVANLKRLGIKNSRTSWKDMTVESSNYIPENSIEEIIVPTWYRKYVPRELKGKVTFFFAKKGGKYRREVITYLLENYSKNFDKFLEDKLFSNKEIEEIKRIIKIYKTDVIRIMSYVFQTENNYSIPYLVEKMIAFEDKKNLRKLGIVLTSRTGDPEYSEFSREIIKWVDERNKELRESLGITLKDLWDLEYMGSIRTLEDFPILRKIDAVLYNPPTTLTPEEKYNRIRKIVEKFFKEVSNGKRLGEFDYSFSELNLIKLRIRKIKI